MRKSIFNFSLALLAVVILFASCTKKDDPIPEPVIPLKVVSASPSNSATGVNVTEKVIVAFNKKPSALTIKGDDFFLIGKDGNEVDCDFSFDGAATMTYSPKKPLNYGELYKVSLENSVADDKSKMTENYKFQFTTEIAPLTVVSVSPADKTPGVKTDSKIVIKFNKKPSTTTQQGLDFVLTDKYSKTVPVTVTYDGVNTVTYQPKEAMYSSETYKATFAGATAEDGAIMGSYSISFTVEKVPFKILSISPADKATGVKISEVAIIMFNKRIVPTKTVDARLYIPGVMSGWAVDYNFAFTGMRLSPASTLVKGKTYNVDFKSVTSEDGDVITDFASSFETEK